MNPKRLETQKNLLNCENLISKPEYEYDLDKFTHLFLVQELGQLDFKEMLSKTPKT